MTFLYRGPAWPGWGNRGWLAGIVLAAAPILLAYRPAQAARIEVTDQDCANITAYQPQPGVAYQPGVDVDGNPVAPADLPGTQTLKLPKSFTIDLNIDLTRYGVSTAATGLSQPAVHVGKLEVTPDGNISFNGQKLDDGSAAAIAKACRERRRHHR